MEENTQVESLYMPIVRHVIQFAGAGLVTSGVMTAGDLQAVTGIVISIGALAWGMCKQKGFRLCTNGKNK